MKLHRVGRLALTGLLSTLCLTAQDWISIGVTGGIPLTDNFANRSFTYVVATIRNPFGPPTTLSKTINTLSGSKNFVLGPTLEVRLPLGFAIEADALYRPMELKSTTTETEFDFLLGSPIGLSSTVYSWEFPLLAKYRFPLGRVQPHLEAGPAFRVIAGSPAQRISGTGAAAGVGVEFRVGHLRIGPEIRYTHWGRDGANSVAYPVVSNRNQVELLAQVMTAPSSSGNAFKPSAAWSEHVGIGVKGGLPFTNAFVYDEFAFVTYPPNCGNSCTSASATIQTLRAPRNYLVGPMIEVYLPRHLSVEADGLYAPLSLAGQEIPSVAGLLLSPTSRTFSSWQFPVVAKYAFGGRALRPFLEAGPTFRVASSLNDYLSHAGVTAGLGVEANIWRLRIGPEVRFVHWGKDAVGAVDTSASRRNQGQFLVSLSY
jgi:hypothetical protein